MIILAVLDAIFEVISSILGVVLPAIPPEIDTYLIAIFNLIENGLDIVFEIFLERTVTIAVFEWMAEIWLVLFGVDLIWRIIDIVRMRHSHQEES